MPLEFPVSLIVPCYNEAKRLDVATFRAFLAQPSGVRLLFVDDGSRDETIATLEQVIAGFEQRAAILRCARNGGKGEAVRLGILKALAGFRPQVVGFWDADLATPLASVDRLLQVLADQPQIEMVFGARVKLLGRHVERRAVRHYLGRVFATVVSNMLGLSIYDSQCGAKLFRVTPDTQAVFADPFLSKWVFDVEVLARYLTIHCKQHGEDPRRLEHIVYEYPLETWSDVAGSKVRASDFLTALIDMVRIRAKYL
ncbi:MAG TPA: glycosyltransferase [Bryobacteraceae bacterium]|nr:glycosyltransferase [Bryobacteraceae bacterium]